MTDLPSRFEAIMLEFVNDYNDASAKGLAYNFENVLSALHDEAMRYAYDHADLEAAAEMTARSSRMQWDAAARLIVAAALGVDDD